MVVPVGAARLSLDPAIVVAVSSCATVVVGWGVIVDAVADVVFKVVLDLSSMSVNPSR